MESTIMDNAIIFGLTLMASRYVQFEYVSHI